MSQPPTEITTKHHRIASATPFLVVTGTWLDYDFPIILGIVPPTDFHSMIFQRGRSTTQNSSANGRRGADFAQEYPLRHRRHWLDSIHGTLDQWCPLQMWIIFLGTWGFTSFRDTPFSDHEVKPRIGIHCNQYNPKTEVKRAKAMGYCENLSNAVSLCKINGVLTGN